MGHQTVDERTILKQVPLKKHFQWTIKAKIQNKETSSLCQQWIRFFFPSP